MNLHEYQAKILLKEFGIPVLSGALCYTPGEVEAAADRLGEVVVVKAQVHAGGRGKGGGVKVCKGAKAAKEAAEKILGMNLVTPQTGEAGKLVRKVYVESGCQIDKEYYLSFLVDRESKCISIIASTEGGMEIEEVAEHTPDKIITKSIDPKVSLPNFQCVELCFALGLGKELIKPFTDLLQKLYQAFIAFDLAMLEINPLVLTKDKQFVVLDAKCAVDDNALFRQKNIASMNDYDESDYKDIQASKYGLSFVALDGNIGCLVNGAGLAMATMDIIKFAGGKPANFLDVGGGATQETVTQAFRILLADTQVKALLVNIFGGIMRCDIIAQGIVDAAKELGVKVPLVVRLQGTNVELGREILSKSGLAITPAATINEAAEKVVKAVAQGGK
jgi:succinyl-CoA synthetase beta subunit